MIHIMYTYVDPTSPPIVVVAAAVAFVVDVVAATFYLQVAGIDFVPYEAVFLFFKRW